MDNEEMIKRVNSVILCLMAHPHNEPDSEFADRIDDLCEVKEALVENNVALSNVNNNVCGKCGKPKNLSNGIIQPLCECGTSGC